MIVAPATGWGRYWIPVVPLLIYYVTCGLGRVVSWVRIGATDRRQTVVVGLALVAVILSNGARDVSGIVDPVRLQMPDFTLGPEWIATHSDPGAEFMAFWPSASYLYSDRKVVPFPDSSVDGPSFFSSLKATSERERLSEAIDASAVSFVLVEPELEYGLPLHWAAYTKATVAPFLEANPARFRLVFSDASRLTRVYQVQR